MKNTKTRILFFCPSFDTPIGGVKQIYRQVDVLNELGFNAFVLHPENNSKETWFKNRTRLLFNKDAFRRSILHADINFKGVLARFIKTYIKKTKNGSFPRTTETEVSSSDILVYPEVFANDLFLNFPKNRFVIYVQECFQIFEGRKDQHDPYVQDNLIGVMLNSKHGKSYMKYVYPNVNTSIIRHAIDSNLFKGKRKKNQIALMSRKLPRDASQLKNIFKMTKYANTWSIVDINAKIKNNTIADVAYILSESKLFINLASTEGFGLPGVEALSSECIVIGYAGFGGFEYMSPEFTFPIPERDILSLVQKTIEISDVLDSSGFDTYADQIQKGKDFVLKTYNNKNESKDIANFWNKVL